MVLKCSSLKLQLQVWFKVSMTLLPNYLKTVIKYSNLHVPTYYNYCFVVSTLNSVQCFGNKLRQQYERIVIESWIIKMLVQQNTERGILQKSKSLDSNFLKVKTKKK